MTAVRFGVVGTGGMGKGHCKMIQECPDAELVGVADAVPEAAREAAEQFEAKLFPDHLAMFDSGEIDAVNIVTPHWVHPDIAVAAFERGIHVLCEKPIAVTVSDADRMIAAADRSDAHFAVMYQNRANPTMRKAQELVQGGEIGELFRSSLTAAGIRTQKYYDSGAWRATWKGEGGGVLLNQAPHALDYFQWIGGMPSQVMALNDAYAHQIEVEDMASALLRYPNGGHGFLHANTVEAPGGNRMEFVGDRGKVIVDGGTVRLCRTSHSIKEWITGFDQMWGSVDATWEDIEVTEQAGGHLAILVNLIAAIRNGEPLASPGSEGLNSVELASAIILSARRSKLVTIPVDRAEYDQLIDELIAGSSYKG